MVCSSWPDDAVISGSSRCVLYVADHGREIGLGHHLVADLSDAGELPHRSAVAVLLHFEAQLVAWHDRAAEARIVEAHEIDELAVERRAQGVDDEDGGGLGHRLDDEDAGHHRVARKMPLEDRLVHRNVLDPDAALVGHSILDAVDHQERIAVRDHLHDALGVDVDSLLRRLFAHVAQPQMLTLGSLASRPFWTSSVMSQFSAASTTRDLLMTRVMPRFWAMSRITTSRVFEICSRPLLRATSSSLRLALAVLRSESNSFSSSPSLAWKSAGGSELRCCSSCWRLARNPC